MPQKNGAKVVQKRRKAKSATKTNLSRSKRTVKSDNLESSLSSSISTQNNLQKLEPKHRSTSTKTEITQNAKLQVNSKETEKNIEIPKNVAVHFGNYYGLNGSSGEKKCQYEINSSIRNVRFSAYSHVKSQFTRQMVHKLESSAGQQHYAKEVSALLEETVEPPNFNIDPPPADNCIPNDKAEASFPLWYRDPNKLVSKTGDYRNLKANYGELTSYLSKYKTKYLLNHDRVLKKKEEEKNNWGFESLEGESDFEEGSTRTKEKEARGSPRLSESASCSESASNSNSTSGCTSVTGKSASESTSTMESTSDTEDDDGDSASSTLSRGLTDADNESQGVDVPVVAL